MKYNPITKQLFTDDGTFLKQLHCPLSKQWDELDLATSLKGKMCQDCNKIVYDTAKLSDDELHQLILINAHSCLKVDTNQANLTITYQQNGR